MCIAVCIWTGHEWMCQEEIGQTCSANEPLYCVQDTTEYIYIRNHTETFRPYKLRSLLDQYLPQHTPALELTQARRSYQPK